MSKRLLRSRRRGVTAIEYGILAALIIVAIIAAVAATGTNLKAVFGQVGGTLENTVAPVPAYAFGGAFETIPSSATSGFCTGYSISGFASSTTGGGILTPAGCGVKSQSTAYADLTSNTLTGDGAYSFISNQAAGQVIAVPALQGAGTGFTIPESVGGVHVRLAKTQSGVGFSFHVYSPSGPFTSTNTTSMRAACTAEGGTLTYNVNNVYCDGGSYYTGTEIAAALPPQ